MYHHISRILPPGAPAAGTPDSLLKAGEWIRAIAQRTGQPVASPENIVWRMDIIGAAELTHPAVGSCNHGNGGDLQRRLQHVMAAG